MPVSHETQRKPTPLQVLQEISQKVGTLATNVEEQYKNLTTIAETQASLADRLTSKGTRMQLQLDSVRYRLSVDAHEVHLILPSPVVSAVLQK